jgi:hypothetical protein
MGYSVTKHAKERWLERVNPNAGDNVDFQIQKALEGSEYVCDQDDIKSFYINSDHLVFCVDTKKNTIITVYEIDYGFPSDINRDIADSLIKKIRKAKNELDKLNDKNKDELEKLKALKDKLNAEIELKELELQKAEALETELQTAAQIKNKEYRILVNQLVDSLAYKKEQLALKNQIA